MSLPSFTPEPASLRHEIVSEDRLAIEFANEAARRFRQLGQGRRGTPEAAAFGELVRDRRQLMGEGRLRLAQRARLNPVHPSMWENGLLAPAEVPAAVVAKLAVAFRKPLAELPLTPYQVDHEPQDAVELEPNGVRVWLGLDTLRPWGDVMVRADEPMSTVGIPLPPIRLETAPP